MRATYKILLVLWSLELALFLASLLLLNSGQLIGWVFLFSTFFGFVIMLIVSAVTLFYTTPKERENDAVARFNSPKL